MAPVSGRGAMHTLITIGILCTTLWLLDQCAHFDESDVLDSDGPHGR